MEKKSFFSSVFGSGCFISIFIRIVWQIILGSFATLLLLLTLIIVYMVAYEGIYKEWIYPKIPKGDKYIEFTKEVNSIAPFYQNEKWGYMNLQTGELIPAQFDHAWPFSEGLAAVIKDKRLMFVDQMGKVAINTELGRMPEDVDCKFINGYCVVNSVEGLTGLIDKQGNWVLQPIYDDVSHDNGLWKVKSNDLYGLFSAELDTMFAVKHPKIKVWNEFIEVSHENHIVKLYDYGMNVLEDFVINAIDNLSFSNIDEDKEYQVGIADQMCYVVYVRDESEPYYGLMDRSGKRITPADYSSIEAIGEDLYFCKPQGIVINGKGKRIE